MLEESCFTRSKVLRYLYDTVYVYLRHVIIATNKPANFFNQWTFSSDC